MGQARLRRRAHCDQPTSWLGAWGRVAPILPALLFAERGQQGGFESFIFYFHGGLGAEPP